MAIAYKKEILTLLGIMSFMDFIHLPEGRRIMEKCGYVPVGRAE